MCDLPLVSHQRLLGVLAVALGHEERPDVARRWLEVQIDQKRRFCGHPHCQLAKVNSGLDALEGEAATFGDRIDLGTIAFACALGYLDFRFASLGWRDARPNTAAWFEWFHGRDSMVETRPA